MSVVIVAKGLQATVKTLLLMKNRNGRAELIKARMTIAMAAEMSYSLFQAKVAGHLMSVQTG
jgi:hypothetical protein